MQEEVRTDYLKEGKKAIVDYVLKSDEEKVRIGIKFNPLRKATYQLHSRDTSEVPPPNIGKSALIPKRPTD